MTNKNATLEALISALPDRRNEPDGVEILHPIDLLRFLPFRFHRLSVKLASERSAQVDQSIGHDLIVRDWRIMVLLANLGPLTNVEIASFANMNAATISRSIALLAKRDLVISQSDLQDRRRTVVSLTPLGAIVYNDYAQQRIQTVNDIEGLLPPEDQNALYRILDKLEERLFERAQLDTPAIDWGSDAS